MARVWIKKGQRHGKRERKTLGMISDEFFSEITEENLLDTICKCMVKVKEN